MIYENKHVTSNFQKTAYLQKTEREKKKWNNAWYHREWDNLNAVLITIIIGDRILI